jgi:hypothetical protein
MVRAQRRLQGVGDRASPRCSKESSGLRKGVVQSDTLGGPEDTATIISSGGASCRPRPTPSSPTRPRSRTGRCSRMRWTPRSRTRASSCSGGERTLALAKAPGAAGSGWGSLPEKPQHGGALGRRWVQLARLRMRARSRAQSVGSLLTTSLTAAPPLAFGSTAGSSPRGSARLLDGHVLQLRQ